MRKKEQIVGGLVKMNANWVGRSLQNLFFFPIIKPIINFSHRHSLVLRAVLKASSKHECSYGEIQGENEVSENTCLPIALDQTCL